MFSDLYLEVARGLFRTGVVRFSQNGFQMELHRHHPDAPLSPYKIKMANLASFPVERLLAAELFRNMIINLDHDVYAAVPTAITPVVTTLSDITGVPFIIPRIDKPRGENEAIDGAYRSGQKVIAFDDVITTAKSKLDAISILTDVGLIVESVIILVDREEGGRQLINNANIELHAAFKITELLRYGADERLITDEQYAEALAYPDLIEQFYSRKMS